MTEAPAKRRESPRAVELLLLCVVAISLGYCALFLATRGYLPPPFVYDTNDDLMDWYNTAYWANNYGSYELWGSIYPPLSFVFVKILSIKSCYALDPFIGRDCDWVGKSTLILLYLINAFLVWKCYRLRDRRTALIRATVLTLSLPMIFALDRGNLIIPCFTCFVLGQGRLLRSARMRWLALALSVNFKPYLVAVLVAQAVRRRWRWLEGAALACLIVYLATLVLWGSGDPAEIVANQIAYAQGEAKGLFEALFYPTSYVSVVNYLVRGVSITPFVGSRPVELLTLWLPLAVRLGQITVVAALGAAALRRAAVPAHRLAALAVAMALSTTELGGYAEVFLLFLVFLERWRGVWPVIALIAAYGLCVPFDLAIATLTHKIQYSYLTGRTVGYDLSVNLGSLVRPGLILVIQLALAAESLADAFARRPSRTAPPAPISRLAPQGV